MSDFYKEVKESYSLIIPESLEGSILERLAPEVERLLVEKKQEVVLSLRNVETVFSVHLTVFVQIYKLLKGFNLRLIISDITPAVLNVMQMTQLENLLPLYLSLDQYEESLGQAKEPERLIHEEEMEFSYSISPESEDRALCVCKGYMSFSNAILKLQDQLIEYKSFMLDFTEVGYIDTRVLILLSDLAEEHFVEIRGASNVLLELFMEHHLEDKFKIIEK